MKYSSILSTLSIPEWKAYNLEYDDIKRLIKLNINPASSDSLNHKISSNTDEQFLTLTKALREQFDLVSHIYNQFQI